MRHRGRTRWRGTRGPTGRTDQEHGESAIDAVILVPAVLLVGALLVMGGRIVQARGAVSSAANEAARAASISRTAREAHDAIGTTVTTTFTDSSVRCGSPRVVPDLGAFSAPTGRPALVSVTVECDVPLADLGLPGAPGTVSISATGNSVLDRYRENG